MIHTGVHVVGGGVCKNPVRTEYSLLFGTLAQLVRAAVTVSGCVSHGFESHMCYIDYQQRLVQFLELNRIINIC